MSEEQKRDSTTGEPEIVDSVPLVPFKVIETDIPFFRDSECQEVVEDARIAILQALDPEDAILEQELVPTTVKYNKGDYVTMNLESKKLWEESWYKDPYTGKIEKAWEVHVSFVGARISESALEKDRERITDLEQRIEQRMRGSAPNVQ
jgi:hypothetical protein